MSSQIKTERSWFMAIFGACFAVPALLIFVLSTLPALYDAVRMQAWVPVQATLLSADIKDSGNKTTTYQVMAKYRYQTDDGTFQGSRVSIHSGSDSIGSYHQNMLHKLSQLRASGQPVQAYYDINNPQDSVIDRSLRWGVVAFKLIFLLIFGIVGGSIIYVALRGHKTNIATETIDKPWLSKPEWMQNKITSSAKAEIYVYGFMAFVINLLSWPAAIAGIEKVYADDGIWLAMLLGLFPLLGLYMFFLFFLRLQKWRRFEKTVLTLNPFPGSIGGQVGGTIEMNAQQGEQQDFKVSLSCIRKYYSKSGNDRKLNERTVWEEDSFAQVTSRGDKSHLAFIFDVPKDLAETDIDQNDSWHLWRVNVESKDGVLKREFEIPVFATEKKSSLRVNIPKHLIEDNNNAVLQAYLPLQNTSSGIQTLTANNHVVIHYPIFHRPANKVFLLLGGGIFLVVGFVLQADMPAFFGVIPLFIGGVMSLLGVYFLLGSLTVSFDTQTVVSTKRFLGIFPRHNKVLIKMIKSIKATEVMRSTRSGKSTVHYKIVGSLAEGKDILLAQQIEGETAKKLVLDYFNKSLRLST